MNAITPAHNLMSAGQLWLGRRALPVALAYVASLHQNPAAYAAQWHAKYGGRPRPLPGNIGANVRSPHPQKKQKTADTPPLPADTAIAMADA
jgi:hypothetical protein